MEGFEVATAALLEKMSICELFAGIYIEVRLPLQSMTHSLQLQNILDSALPDLSLYLRSSLCIPTMRGVYISL